MWRLDAKPRPAWAAATAGLWALVALAACAATPNRLATAAHADPRLFTAAYHAITTHYLEPIAADRLALAGLAKMAKADDGLSVTTDGRTVTLRLWRESLLERSAPAATDETGWGELTAEILDTARAHSATIAQMPEDRLDEVVIDGSITILDKFTRYAPPAAAAERRDTRDGYSGIGVTLDTEGPEVRIASVMPDSPAADAGLASGDRIAAVDGVDAFVLSHEEVADRMRGPIGSLLRLGISRDGLISRLDIMIKRSHIVLRTVALTHDQHIAVLRLTSFNASTAENLKTLLAEAHGEMGANLTGIVLDLRGNPGGLLDQSVRVASLFLDRGLVVSTTGRVAGSDQIFEVERPVPAERVPLVVLVNGGSASSSEIVASALQDEGRAVIVGTSSYGKGTVQNVVHLPNQGELTVTWARLIPPGGYILHEHGVVPAVCTANLSDAAKAAPFVSLPRAALDDAGWTSLRDHCPPDRVEHDIELDVAKRVLTDPALYARALADEPAKPVRSASIK